MYSFFELSGSQGVRSAVAAVGSLIITAVLMLPTVSGAFQPASPAVLTLATGVLA
ncbi:hypothetical protein NAP1_08402 [Erythrobacter sp. NAP1]|uniref:hypothetical protein n=1 Tax=Erythrobacter sp. NAP1 TaxID=237727 RepID=UPI0000685204|nr:hypothetical protein [Erythrobacter sp. NAP1]EAQ27599.1 hypothetical protein NAP1_08402 [Erythrobacter sp. NAP1]